MAWTDYLPRWARRSASAAAPLALPGGAPVGEVFRPMRRQAAWSDPLDSEGDAGLRLVQAIRAADNGDPRSLQAAIEGALTRDSRMAGVYRARILAITSRRWTVRPPVGLENDREALDTAMAVSRVFYATPRFERARAQLAQGIGRGVALLEHDWQLDVNGARVSRPRYVGADRLVIDDNGEWAKRETGDGRAIPLSCWPDKFVVHSPSAGLELPAHKRGALRPLLHLAIAKRYTLRWCLEMIERYGQPQVYGSFDSPETPTTLLDEMVESLESLSSQWRAAFRGGAKVEALPVSVNDRIHLAFCDWVNTEYAVALLGGNLTTEVKDGQTFGSTAQERVRGDILASDLVELDETITDQWVEPLVRFNRPGAPIPVFESASTSTRPYSLAEYQAGVCTLNQYLTSNGFDATDDPRGEQYAASPSLPPASQGMPLALTGPSGGADAAAPFRSSPTRASGATLPSSTSPLGRALRRS